MSSITYNQLVADIKQWIEDPGADFDAAVARIVALGEQRVMRDLDFDIFFKVATGNIALDTLAVPSDYISPEHLYVNSSIVEKRSYDWVRDYGGTGTPRYFANKDQSNLLLKPTPSGSMPYELRYRCKPTGISSGNQTTWISENIPEGLFYACLLEAEAQLKADERIPVWTAAYTDAIQKFKDNNPELARKSYP